MHKTIAALVLALTVSPMAAWAADGPGRGMSKAQVRQQFGEPARVQAPVGNPPIGRWHYPDFTVYFENDIVLHSVSEDRAARGGEDDGAEKATTIRERREGKSLPADVENEEAQIEVESRIENRDADSDDDRDSRRDDDGETDESDVAPGTTGVRAAGGDEEREIDRDDAERRQEQDQSSDRFRFDPASGRIVIDGETPPEDADKDEPLSRTDEE